MNRTEKAAKDKYQTSVAGRMGLVPKLSGGKKKDKESKKEDAAEMNEDDE